MIGYDGKKECKKIEIMDTQCADDTEMEESMSLICKDIVKTYNKTDVLKNINLEIEQGKIYGLIGRNGAGKTTLLSVLTAQNPATRGTVSYKGTECYDGIWPERNENQRVFKNCFGFLSWLG